jgi:predicted CXXCH cytochrome family protein
VRATHRFWGLSALSVLALVFFLPLSIQSRVKDTPHNLNTQGGITVPNSEVCRPCHTPHNAIAGEPALWNHTLSTAAWTLHDGATADTLSHGSKMCLSCHDGTVALDSYGGATGTQFIGGTENLGTDLVRSHPVGVEYPTSTRYNQPDADGHVVDPVETPAGTYGNIVDGRVQCESCHYAHGSRAAYGMFLRIDNTGSAMCMTCHVN